MLSWGRTVTDATAMKKASEVAEALNLLGIVAAPLLLARWNAQAAPADLHAVLTARLGALAGFCEHATGSPDAERFRTAAPRVRAFAEEVAGASPAHFPLPSWTLLARECFEALGFPAPPSGWDAFEGWTTVSG